MSSDSRIKLFLTATLLPFLLIVSFIGSEGTLLCFGKEGHVAIEFVEECNSIGVGSQLAEMESDACGPCMDVQFLSSPAYSRISSHNTQTLPMVSLSSVPISLPVKEYFNENINLPATPHHKTLASLHSVILLI